MGQALCCSEQELGSEAPEESNQEQDQFEGEDGAEGDHPGSNYEARDDYRIYASLEALEQEQKALIAEAIDCTGVSEDEAYVFLQSVGWEVTMFNASFFENTEALRQRVGLSDSKTARAEEDEADQLCGICFTSPGLRRMPCEERFLGNTGSKTEQHPLYCEDCWRSYLQHAVREGKTCLKLRCPTPGCNEAVRPSAFACLEAQDAERYRRFLIESLVDNSEGRRRWCPGQGCGRACEELASQFGEVKCPCGKVWCFRCGIGSHQPAPCIVVREWNLRNKDVAADALWIKAYTKLCPKCSNPIEKNGGCMHMTCRTPGGCGHEFCWICLQDWKTHKECNRMQTAENQDAEQAQVEVMRYAHYYERFLAHHNAEAFARSYQMKQMKALADKIHKHMKCSISDTDFLKDGCLQVQLCRSFLKWTFALGYFAKLTDAQRNLFEFHQAQLLTTLEHLCDLLENTPWERQYLSNTVFTLQPYYQMRSRTISVTEVVHKFFNSFSEALEQNDLVPASCIEVQRSP
eukprot:TRINITY_DN90484_c0_g1_i1.p1 TRINITY_DN90484_c0_g1~~TRINITY_DN90484_c0_g1_i1.p1  ORF type:complete len:534 (-),score=94.57 TRINITY_DN90484_c0_g1_i1:611-2167(-)